MAPPAPVRSYHLDRTAFEVSVKRRFSKRLAATLPWVLVVLIPFWLLLAKVQEDDAALAPLMALVVGFVLFAHFRARHLELKHGRPAWDSYQLSLSPNAMRRHTSGLPAIEIVRPEVTQIIETPGEGLTVATADRQRSIFVPEALVDFQALRCELEQWRELERPSPGRALAADLGGALLLLGLWIGSAWIPDIRLAMLAGLALMALVAHRMREVARSPLATSQQKARVIGPLIFFLFAPVARLILYLAQGIEGTWPK